MTVYSSHQGPRKPIRVKITTTSATTIYAGGKANTYLDSINFCNITGSAATIDLFVNDGSTSFYILKGHSLAGAASYKVTELAADVNEGETLQVQSDTGNAIDVVGVLIQQVGSQGGA